MGPRAQSFAYHVNWKSYLQDGSLNVGQYILSQQRWFYSNRYHCESIVPIMASQKPAILSANFFRAVRSCRPQTYRTIRNQPVTAVRRRQLHASSRRLQQDQGYQRYGPAATPSMPPPPKPAEPFLPSTEQTQRDASDTELKKTERKKQEAKAKAEAEAEKTEEPEAEEEEEEESEHVEQKPEIVNKHELEAAPQEQEQIRDVEAKSDAEAESATDQNPLLSKPPESEEGPLPNKELDIVLSIPSPSEIKGTDGQSTHHPHLEASPYEHHFDTYTLVQDLCKEGPNPEDPNNGPASPFTDPQSVTLMKAIRLMLAQNLDLAKDGLVSKSDTENETYLFRAACSELKTTMQTSRFMEAQKQRSQRAQLQHEFDILNQKVSQDIITMREELKGMFNDRKLGLQEEKRQVDGKIQGLSYRISVDLNSEAKSEVEGLRWVLTRRAAFAILAGAAMVLSFLQYYSVKSREQAEIEKKRKAAQREQEERMKREQERFGGSGATIGRSMGTQTDGIVLGGTAGANYDGGMS